MSAALNDNRLVWGITALLFNVGQRHVFSDLGKVHEHLLTRGPVKLLVVMSMFFMFTRDIVVTLGLTGIYFLVFMDMLHENGRFSVVPRAVRDALLRDAAAGAKVEDAAAGAAGAGTQPSFVEYVKARHIVHAYERQRAP